MEERGSPIGKRIGRNDCGRPFDKQFITTTTIQRYIQLGALNGLHQSVGGITFGRIESAVATSDCRYVHNNRLGNAVWEWRPRIVADPLDRNVLETGCYVANRCGRILIFEFDRQALVIGDRESEASASFKRNVGWLDDLICPNKTVGITAKVDSTFTTERDNIVRNDDARSDSVTIRSE